MPLAYPAARTLIFTFCEILYPAASFTVTTTVYEPGFVAVPEISPVVLSIASPLGRPLAVTLGYEADDIPSLRENALPAAAFAAVFASFLVELLNLSALLSSAAVKNFA